MPDEIDMPPQYAGEYSDPKDTEGKVAEAVRNEVGERMDRWLQFVLSAVSDFGDRANLHIDQLEYEHDATYDFNPVLASFATALLDYFPPTKMAKSIVSTAMGGLEDSYAEKLNSGLTGAKLRLKASVVALNHAARKHAMNVVSTIQDQVPDPETGLTKLEAIVDDGMTWVDSASTDPGYVSALCDWMGFPEPTRANTYNPVRQSLENPFFGVYQGVRAQLLRTQGVAGLDDDDLSPTIWEHEAIESQRKLYNESSTPEEQEAAWEKAYEGILPDRP
jgi:hypothetical protein